MFLLRSVFWLGAAFLVMQPHLDLKAAASSLSATAVASGQQVAVGIATGNCTTLQCQGGKALLSKVFPSAPSSVSTMQDSHAVVPIPRPRPDWMG